MTKQLTKTVFWLGVSANLFVTLAIAQPIAPPAAPGGAPATATATATAAGAARSEKDPPGAQGALPASMDAIAKAVDVPYRPKPAGHLVKFNLQDADLSELVNHISGLTGRRFIYGQKVRQIKATVVSPEPVTLAEAYETFLSILESNGMTVIPHGRFYKIVDSGGVVNQVTPVVSRGEPLPRSDRYVTRLYRMQNIGADEAAALVTKFKSKEADISVYAPGRLIIMTDTGANIDRMIRILEEIDVGGAGQSMWIERINYGTATDYAQRINELFGLGAPPGPANMGAGLTKVIADAQSNSLIIVGTEDSYTKLLQMLKRLDAQPAEAGHARVVNLQHAKAEELANILTQMVQGAKKEGAAAGPAGQANRETFEGEVKLTSDKATNSIVIMSSGRDYATLRLLIADLDMPRRQVFIEAVIMDLDVTDSMQLGTSWHGGDQENLGGGGPSTFLGGYKAGDSLQFPRDPNLLQGMALGVRGPSLPGSDNLIAPGVTIPAFGVVMQALTTSGASNVLATPHVIATDNVAAEIHIGKNVPLQQNLGGGLSSLAGLAGGTTAGANPAAALTSMMPGMMGGYNAQRQDVGIKIKVTPHINNSSQVRLELEQESSDTGAPTGALGAVPIIKRTANTTITVDDQQTVVIGGLMRDEQSRSEKKVPVLGDIPILGFLFRTTTNEKKKSNLMLILTPYILRDQADLRKVFERKMQERQEFLDRYFVFSGRDWTAPKDYSRANGLVENIRQSYFKVEEQLRLLKESEPTQRDHRPGLAIELPEVPSGVGGSMGALAPSAAGAAPAGAAAAAPGAPGATPPAALPGAATGVTPAGPAGMVPGTPGATPATPPAAPGTTPGAIPGTAPGIPGTAPGKPPIVPQHRRAVPPARRGAQMGSDIDAPVVLRPMVRNINTEYPR
jgi:general secretion pathway protein D